MTNNNPPPELMPCPFCSYDARIITYEYGQDIPRGFSVECTGCFAETAHSPTLEEAVQVWNTRATLKPARLTDDEIKKLIVPEEGYGAAHRKGWNACIEFLRKEGVI